MSSSINLSHFGLGIDVPYISPSARSFCPPSWPPPKDWVCIEDKNGNAISRYGDHVWDFTPWLGKIVRFNFCNGKKTKHGALSIDHENAELLRQLVVWRGWKDRPAITASTLISFANSMRAIVAICSANKILASDLWRYPAVIDQIWKAVPPSRYNHVIAELDRLRDARNFLGFELLDASGISYLKARQPKHSIEQTEYIPPRIWSYVVNRVADCLNEYLAHQSQIEACFAFCINAYKENNAAELRNGIWIALNQRCDRNPFNSSPRITTATCYGPFVNTAKKFGIKEVIERWNKGFDTRQGILNFAQYLSTIQYAALINIAAFTLMRIKEASSVRWDCLRWHDDPAFGRIPLIQAETTKTDADDKGLWITSPSVEPAIRALQSIAKLRLTSVGRWVEGGNPALLTAPLEPWWGGKKMASQLGLATDIGNLLSVIRDRPKLFDPNQLTITADDFKIAKAVCPSLNAEKFQVGKPWAFAWHQFRRTGAVNMFASGLISDSSMQLQMKHLTRWQPLYYGRGNTALHLNDTVRVLLVNAQYEAMGREAAAAHTDRFVSPHGEEHKARLFASTNGGEPVNLLSEGDAQHYEKQARLGRLNFRLTVLGACMNNGACDGDCMSSVSDCAGGDGSAPCAHVLFDRTHAEANQRRLEGIIEQLAQTPPDTPRHNALNRERRGLENYFAYIKKTA